MTRDFCWVRSISQKYNYQCNTKYDIFQILDWFMACSAKNFVWIRIIFQMIRIQLVLPMDLLLFTILRKCMQLISTVWKGSDPIKR